MLRHFRPALALAAFGAVVSAAPAGAADLDGSLPRYDYRRVHRAPVYAPRVRAYPAPRHHRQPRERLYVPRVSYVPTPRVSYVATPRVSYVNTPRVTYETTPRVRYVTTPRVTYVTTPQVSYERTARVSYVPTPRVSYVATPRVSYVATPRVSYVPVQSYGLGSYAGAHESPVIYNTPYGVTRNGRNYVSVGDYRPAFIDPPVEHRPAYAAPFTPSRY